MEISPQQKKSVPFKYAADVAAGKIVTGKYVKLAVQRFYNQIENAEAMGYRLDHSKGMKIIDFFRRFLVHTKGRWAGQPFELNPWQQFTYYNVFGWQVKDSTGQWVRLYKTVYEKVARKNGKTAGVAGVGIFCQGFDGEKGAEVYVGATKEEQAKICWNQAKAFVDVSPVLRRSGFKALTRQISFTRPGIPEGVYKFLGGDSKTQDGLNPNLAIIDEYHAHPTDGVREVLESAMGARQQPLMWIITTAGFNKDGVQEAYDAVCKEILRGEKQDPNTFIMIHELDESDSWTDPSCWVKANPNLGQGVSMDYLQAEFKKAINQTSKAYSFKTKNLNIPAEGQYSFMSTETWDKNYIDQLPDHVFRNYGAWAGVDMSTDIDFSAFVIISKPDADGICYMKPFLFCPLDTIDKRAKEDRVPVKDWLDKGYIIATPGQTIDYDLVEGVVAENAKYYNTDTVFIDPWNTTQFASNLLNRRGLNVEFCQQGIRNLSGPTKHLKKLIIEGRLKYEKNPAMRWMLSACIEVQDANENIKLHKAKSQRQNVRIDGIVAAVMAAYGQVRIVKDNNTSQYAGNTENFIM